MEEPLDAAEKCSALEQKLQAMKKSAAQAERLCKNWQSRAETAEALGAKQNALAARAACGGVGSTWHVVLSWF